MLLCDALQASATRWPFASYEQHSKNSSSPERSISAQFTVHSRTLDKTERRKPSDVTETAVHFNVRSERSRGNPASRCWHWSSTRAGRRREHSVRIRPDQTNRANHYYQDHSQHHGVFRDILALIVCPEFRNEISHRNASVSIFLQGWSVDAGGEP